MISAAAVISLAAIGGMASLCFTRVFGIVFQGSPRKEDLKNVKEVPFLMKAGMVFPALFAVFAGMTSFLLLSFIEKPAAVFTGEAAAQCFKMLEKNMITLSIVLAASLLFIIIILFIKERIFKKNSVKTGNTWGCGYSFPSARMQYTASSYAAPALDKFSALVAAKKTKKFTDELFPGSNWSFSSQIEDWFLSRIYIKAVKAVDRVLSLLRWFQCGRAGIYVMYAASAVVILIIWKFVI